MKRLFSMLALAALVFTSCSDERFDSGEGNNSSTPGTFSLALTPSGSFIDTHSKAGAAVDVNLFKVIIKTADGSIAGNWDQYRDFPAVLSLKKGSYTIEASSPGDLPAAFDQPIYQGSQAFTIEASKLAAVNLICKLSNMKVEVTFTEAFKAEILDYTAVVSTPGDNGGILTFNSSNLGSSGYFKVAPLTIQVTGRRKLDNSEIAQTAYINEVAAQDFHKITLDAVETGNMQPNITIDATTNDKETSIIIPGEGEDVVTTPVVTGDGILTPLVVTNTQATTTTANVNASTPGSTIANLWVELDSPALTESIITGAGLTKKFDLATVTPGSAMEQALKSFGLLPSGGAAAILGQASYAFGINTTFMALLPSDPTTLVPPGTGDRIDHKFIVTLTDANGYSTTKTMTITRTADPAAGQAPVITGSGIGTTLVLTDAQAGEEPVDITVTTPESTIAELWVELDSPLLTDAMLEGLGLPKKFDLANLDPSTEAILKDVQLIPADGDPIKGLASYVFSIGGFMGVLTSDPTALDPPGTGDHVNHMFHLTVTNATGQTTKATLTVERRAQ